MIFILLNFEIEVKTIKFNGDKIYIYQPVYDKKYPFIIFSGGMNSPALRYESFSRFLAQNGYIVIVPDYKGYLFLWQIPFKILKIVDHLNEIDSKIDSIGCLGGHSLGAYYSLLVSPFRRQIKCVFTFSPPLLPIFYSKIKIPVLIFAATNDKITTIEDNQKIIYGHLSSPKKLIIIKGGNHNGYMDRWAFVEEITDGHLSIKHEEQQKIVRESVLVFLKNYLK